MLGNFKLNLFRGGLLCLWLSSGFWLRGQTTNYTCENAIFICDFGTYLPIQNGNTQDYFNGSYGCLGFTYNASWAVFGIQEGGQLEMEIRPVDSIGGSTGADLDFIVWGPFNESTGNCAALDSSANVVDCAYTPGSVIEQISISNVQAGEFYVLVVTNYTDMETGAILAAGANNTAILSTGIGSLPPIEITGKQPVSIELPTYIQPLKFFGPGIQDTLIGVIDPCVIEGPGPHYVEVIGESDLACIDTMRIEISICQDQGVAVSCQQNFTVTLGEDCATTLTKCMVLEGNCVLGLDEVYGISRLVVRPRMALPSRLDTVTLEDAIVQGAGEFVYGIYYQTGEGMWELFCNGDFQAKDWETTPFVGWQSGQVIFEQRGSFVTNVIQKWSAQIQADSENKSTPGWWSCWQDWNLVETAHSWPSNQIIFWDTLMLTADHTSSVLASFTDSIYNGVSNAVMNPIMAVYQENYDPQFPCRNLVAINRDHTGQAGSLNGVEWLAESGHDYIVWVGSEVSAPLSFEVNFQDFTEGTLSTLSLFNHPALSADTVIGYREFLTVDLPQVMLPQQQNLTADQYFGGNIEQLAEFLAVSGPNDSLDGWLYSFGQDLLEPRNYYGYFNETSLWRSTLLDSVIWKYGWMPYLVENCGSWEVAVTDRLMKSPDCGAEMVVSRYFVALGQQELNTRDTAVVHLKFRRPHISDVIFPAYTVDVPCDADTIATGFPYLSTLSGVFPIHNNRAPTKNISAVYDDGPILSGCGTNYSFFRNWMIYDWCQPANSIDFKQLVRVGDWDGPEWNAESIGFETSFSPNSCSGAIDLTIGQVTDQCSETYVEVQLKGMDQELSLVWSNRPGWEGNSTALIWDGVMRLTAKGLAPGLYQGVWIAEDACGWRDTLVQSISLEDQLTPICISEDTLVVNLAQEVLVKAERLDAGSYDFCEEVSFSIRKNAQEAWGKHLYLDCTDEGQEIAAELLVVAGTQTSTCNTVILVKNSERPTCEDLETVLLRCEEVNEGGWDKLLNSYFDTALSTAGNNCPPVFEPNIETDIQLHSCGYGYVNRYFSLQRDLGHEILGDTCRASLVIARQHQYQILFPSDTLLACAAKEVPEVSFESGACDLITQSVQEEFLQTSSEYCAVINRNFRIINWCEYQENTDANPIEVTRMDRNGDGRAEGTYLRVDWELGFWHYFNTSTGQDSLWVGDATASSDEVYREWNPGQDTTSIRSLNRFQYEGLNPGFFAYQQRIQILDESAPIVQYLGDVSYPAAGNESCMTTVNLPFQLEDYCALQKGVVRVDEIGLDLYSDGIGDMSIEDWSLDRRWRPSDDSVVSPEIELISPVGIGEWEVLVSDLPIGLHTLYLGVHDGCGNRVTFVQEFEVIDVKGPAPSCVNGLAIALSNDGNGNAAGLLIASDFVVNSPIEDCSGDSEEYYITTVRNIDGTIKSADQLMAANNKTLLVNCQQVGTLEIAVIATDQSPQKNKDYCITQVEVQDNNGSCEASAQNARIQGSIVTALNQPIEGIAVEIYEMSAFSGSLQEEETVYLDKVITPKDGNYSFEQLSDGASYKIVPEVAHADNLLKGISTLDLVYISKHILGIQPFENPYQFIAADVNNSGTISTLDMVILRQNLLLTRFDFGGNASWRFIPKSYTLDSLNNPLETGWEEYQVIDQMETDIDFIGIKVGDVNFSALGYLTARSDNSSIWTVENQWVHAGEIVEIEIQVPQGYIGEGEGMQWALQVKEAEILEVQSNWISKEDLEIFIEGKNQWLLNSSVFNQGLEKYGPNEKEGDNLLLLTLAVRPESSGYLADILTLGREGFAHEYYPKNGFPQSIIIDWITPGSWRVGSVYPNPITHESILSVPVEVSEAGEVVHQIHNPLGKVIFFQQTKIEKGAQNITIDVSKINKELTGIHYITTTFKGKMVGQTFLFGGE